MGKTHEITIEEFLVEERKANSGLNIIIKDLLRGIPVEKFFERFGKMTKEEMAEFIVSCDKAFEIAQWGYAMRDRNYIRMHCRPNGKIYNRNSGKDCGLDER